jgi:hypothetical protein
MSRRLLSEHLKVLARNLAGVQLLKESLGRKVVGHAARIDQDAKLRKARTSDSRQLPQGLIDRKTAGKLLKFDRSMMVRATKKELLVPHMNPNDASETLFYQSDVEALKRAKKMRPLSALQVRTLLLQALSSSRSVEVQLAEMRARLGMDVAFLDRNPSAVEQLYADVGRRIGGTQLRSVKWLRFWAGTLLAIDHYYLLLGAVVLNTDEPWVPLLDFAAEVVKDLEKNTEDLEASPALRDAYQYFKVAQHHIYAVSYITCRSGLGRDATKKLFPDGLSAKQQLKRLLQ